MAANLGLIIPGLFDFDLSAQSKLPALNRLLKRSIAQPSVVGFERVLCHTLGATSTDTAELPIARLCYPIDQPRLHTEQHDIVLRADPIHLRPELHQVYAHPLQQITQNEATALQQSFNEIWQDDGITLEVPKPQRWYLRSHQSPRIHTQPLSEILGRDVTGKLPTGADAPHWHRLLTECQMLFYTHPVNQTRAQSINSLWLWGGGALPATPTTAPFTLYADDVLAQGLAHWGGFEQHPLPPTAADLNPIQNTLVVLPLVQTYDMNHCNDLLNKLEQNWFKPLLATLKRRHWSQLYIDSCAGQRFYIKAPRLFAIWRRSG